MCLVVAAAAARAGETPRHFQFDPSGQWLLVANQDSDTVATFQFNISTGSLKYTGAGPHNTRAVLQNDDPNHLGMRCNTLPERRMALIISGCVPPGNEYQVPAPNFVAVVQVPAAASVGSTPPRFLKNTVEGAFIRKEHPQPVCFEESG